MLYSSCLFQDEAATNLLWKQKTEHLRHDSLKSNAGCSSWQRCTGFRVRQTSWVVAWGNARWRQTSEVAKSRRTLSWSPTHLQAETSCFSFVKSTETEEIFFNMTTYGLPRAVIQLLKTMEAYRDCLKWNVQEGTHKITLTLAWSFKTKPPPPQSGKEWLWNKIQVVQNKLRLTKSEDGLPMEVCRFLEAAGPVTPPRRPPLRRQFSLGKVTWHANQWHSMPSPGATRYPTTRHASLSPPPASRSFHKGLSTRFSWPGASSPMAIRGGSLDETQPTQPKASTPLRKSKTLDPASPPLVVAPHSITPIRRSNAIDYSDGVPSLPSFDSLDSPSCADESQCSSSSQRNNANPFYTHGHRSPSPRISPRPPPPPHSHSSPRVKLTYRTEAELEKSLEDLVERQRKENHSKLERIRYEWNKSMREAMADPITTHGPDEAETEPDTVDIRENGLDENNASTSDSDPDLNIPETNQTVQKCLSTCDSILYKHSTLIT